MGFEFSTMLSMMWNHPLLCGSVLLLLTPSLFHILLYFSPLLISTALFVVALISMGPRMEETQQEREKWAKGEKPIESDENWPYTDWMQPDAEPVVVRKSRGEDKSSSSWLEMIEEGKSKLAVWIDNLFKASGEARPLVNVVETPVNVPGTTSSSVSEKTTPVPDPPAPVQVSKPVPEKVEVVEEPEQIKTVEVNATPALKPSPPEAPVDVAEDVKFTEKELDMPELEVVEVPEAELAKAEMVAAEVLVEKKSDDQPVWDEPHEHSDKLPAEENLQLPLTEDDLMDVPLNDPVQETLHEERDESKLGSSTVTEPDPAPVSVGGATTKHVHFSAAASSPPPAPSSREVHKEILKNLRTQLHELESKKRNKYTQILSRRMSSKNGTWH